MASSSPQQKTLAFSKRMFEEKDLSLQSVHINSQDENGGFIHYWKAPLNDEARLNKYLPSFYVIVTATPS